MLRLSSAAGHRRASGMLSAKWRSLVTLAVSVACGLHLVPAYGDSTRSYWLVRNELAYTSQVFPDAKAPGATATLTVDFSSANDTCFPMIGVAFLKGAKFGTPGARGKS